jgi:hypothetical protein
MMTLEEAQEAHNSSVWQKIVGELAHRQRIELAVLRKVSTNDLIKVQARIGLLDEIMRLPEDVIDRESSGS